MKEIIKMWKYPNMIAMTAFSSAIYVAFLVPFKSAILIPGFTEIRPASLFPVIFGLLFGPAGAWGSAIGNLVGDLFGTLSYASIFGFIGNFMYAYIPYKLWGKLGVAYREDLSPTTDSAKKLIEFGGVTVISSAACAAFISWGCDVMKLVPFANLAAAIMLNNTVMTLILGPIVLPFLYRVFKKWGMLWTDILKPEPGSEEPPRIFSILTISGALGGLGVGIATSLGIAGQTLVKATELNGGAGQIGVAMSVLPFLAMLFYGLSQL